MEIRPAKHGASDDRRKIWRTGYFPAEAIRQNDGIVGKQLEGDKPVPICIAWTKDSWKQEEVQQFIKEIMKFYGAVR